MVKRYLAQETLSAPGASADLKLSARLQPALSEVFEAGTCHACLADNAGGVQVSQGQGAVPFVADQLSYTGVQTEIFRSPS